MDHVVYVDAAASELEKLLEGAKSMIIRGAAGRKLPYGRVNPGDLLYFIRNNGEGIVRARCRVTDVVNSERLTPEECDQMIASNQGQLQLTQPQMKRWAGKRFLVFVSVAEVEPIEPFAIDRSEYGNMDDWLPVEDIQRVRA